MLGKSKPAKLTLPVMLGTNQRPLDLCRTYFVVRANAPACGVKRLCNEAMCKEGRGNE